MKNMNLHTLKGFFMELEKNAGWLSNTTKPGFWDGMGQTALKGAGFVAGALGLELVAEGSVEWLKQRNIAKAKDPAFQKVLEVHPELKDYPFDKVMLYWDHLYKFTPSLAADPLAAGAYIRQSLEQFDTIGGPPHDTVKNLVSIEGEMEDVKGGRRPTLKALSAIPKETSTKFQFGGGKHIHN